MKLSGLNALITGGSQGLGKTIALDRRTSLDTIDFPLNNRLWLQERFAGLLRFYHGEAA